MRTLIIGMTLCGLVALTARAADTTETDELNRQIKELLQAAPTGPHGGKIISPEIRALMNRRSGGLVVPKTNGKTFLLVDARGVKDDFIEKYVGQMKTRFHLDVTPVTKTVDAKANLFAFAQGLKTTQSPAVVLIVDRAGLPTLSIYPEETVGIVNVAPLKSTDEGLYRARLSKEIWRCLGFAFGNGASAAPNGHIAPTILSAVHSVKELDAMKAVGLAPAQCNAIYDSVSSLGLQAAKPTPYSIACRQGWAPAPTNSIQKAIWDKVHEPPKTPMKIEFDPKKGR